MDNFAYNLDKLVYIQHGTSVLDLSGSKGFLLDTGIVPSSNIYAGKRPAPFNKIIKSSFQHNHTKRSYIFGHRQRQQIKAIAQTI